MIGLPLWKGSENKPTQPCVDFQGIAGLVDATFGHAPERLEILLKALLSSNERLETCVVLELTAACRDPLSRPWRLCGDALQTAADLELVLRGTSRRSIDDTHACALLNLADAILSNDTLHAASRRRRIRLIRPQIELAAARETSMMKREIARVRAMREARIPNVWKVFEEFVKHDKASVS